MYNVHVQHRICNILLVRCCISLFTTNQSVVDPRRFPLVCRSSPELQEGVPRRFRLDLRPPSCDVPECLATDSERKIAPIILDG